MATMMMRIPLVILAICFVEVAHCGLKKQLLYKVICLLDELEEKCDKITEKLDAICDKLEVVTDNLDTMNNTLTVVSGGVVTIQVDLEDMNNTLEVIQECACEDGTCKPDEVVIVACGLQFEAIALGGGTYSLTASLPNTAREWCMAVFPPVTDKPCKYSVDADLYNHYFENNVGKGHVGFAFNIQDERNFDMIYFRIGQPAKCRVHGAQIGDIKHIYSQAITCPPHQTWFHLRIEVEPGSAKAFLDGSQIDEWSTEMEFRAYAAVLTANSYWNTIYYKNFVIEDF